MEGPRPAAGSPLVMEHVVELDRVGRSYFRGDEEVRALDELSLTMAAGELVALVGPSGCGKSTALNLVAAVDRPDRGTVRVCGIDVAAATESEIVTLRRRRIGMVFQAFHLVPHLTVEENVALPLALDGRREPERVRELIDRVGLAHRRRHYPSELSGG
jgi:putative ABC transport system ATP-binding protein